MSGSGPHVRAVRVTCPGCPPHVRAIVSGCPGRPGRPKFRTHGCPGHVWLSGQRVRPSLSGHLSGPSGRQAFRAGLSGPHVRAHKSRLLGNGCPGRPDLSGRPGCAGRPGHPGQQGQLPRPSKQQYKRSQHFITHQPSTHPHPL